MGIENRHLNEQRLVLKVPGDAAAAAHVDWGFADFDGYIDNIWAEVGTAGVTGSMVVDVNLNGTTIFSAAGKITFGAAVSPSSYSALATPRVSKGDKISMDIDSVHTTEAINLTVYIVLRRKGHQTVTNLAPSALHRH